MSQLGNFVSEDDLETLIRERLIPGVILHVWCDFTTPPKEKFLVVLSTEPECLVCLISSKIHPFNQKKEKLVASHVELHRADYDFLDHNSYANCNNVYMMEIGEIVDQCKKVFSRIKGNLTEPDSGHVLRAIQDSVLVSGKHKKVTSASLK